MMEHFQKFSYNTNDTDHYKFHIQLKLPHLDYATDMHHIYSTFTWNTHLYGSIYSY